MNKTAVLRRAREKLARVKELQSQVEEILAAQAELTQEMKRLTGQLEAINKEVDYLLGTEPFDVLPQLRQQLEAEQPIGDPFDAVERRSEEYFGVAMNVL